MPKGTYTFSADGGYSISLILTTHAVLVVPASCIGLPGILQSCSALEQGMTPAPSSGSATSQTVACSGTSDCTCNSVGTKSVTVAGSYRTQGGTLTFAPYTNYSTLDDPYCVSGNQITVALSPGDGMSTAQATMVLTRQ